MLIEKDQNDNIENYNLKDGYDKEEKFLLIKRKEELSSKLLNISENLKNKKDIDTFLQDMVNETNQLSGDEIDKEMNISCVRFIIKVLGPIFVGLHLIGIFQMNGMMILHLFICILWLKMQLVMCRNLLIRFW